MSRFWPLQEADSNTWRFSRRCVGVMRSENFNDVLKRRNTIWILNVSLDGVVCLQNRVVGMLGRFEGRVSGMCRGR